MKPIDYFAVIHKYIPPGSALYRLYIPHASLVTAKALSIAKRLRLSAEQQRFIEEASMLHDIGVVEVEPFALETSKKRPYLCHAPLGREILEHEGLVRHALVAERHIGLGISREDILEQQLPLPPRDMLAESLEEKIICWADLFFSKSSHMLWNEKSVAEVRKSAARYGERQLRVFSDWLDEFESEECRSSALQQFFSLHLSPPFCSLLPCWLWSQQLTRVRTEPRALTALPNLQNYVRKFHEQKMQLEPRRFRG
jgi:uncharacterized protein